MATSMRTTDVYWVTPRVGSCGTNLAMCKLSAPGTLVERYYVHFCIVHSDMVPKCKAFSKPSTLEKGTEIPALGLERRK